jgi:hypothetical protein
VVSEKNMMTTTTNDDDEESEMSGFGREVRLIV